MSEGSTAERWEFIRGLHWSPDGDRHRARFRPVHCLIRGGPAGARSPRSTRWGSRSGRRRSRSVRSSASRSSGPSTWPSGAWTSRRSRARTRPARSSRCARRLSGPTRPTRRSRRWPPCASTRRWCRWRPPAAGYGRPRGERGRARSRAGSGRSTSGSPRSARPWTLGADEIDIVLNRSAFLVGRYRQAFEEIAASKEACGDAHLKVILETGELGSYDRDPAGVGARDGRRGRLHQDLHREDRRERHAPGGALHDGGGARLLPRDGPARRGQGGRRRPHSRSRRSSTWCSCTRRWARSG